MYHDKPRKNKKSIICKAVALIFSAICFLFAGSRFYNMLSADMNAQAMQSVKRAVQNAAVQCYAVEGAYPQSIKELEEGYGVRINRKKFVVSYEAFASNVMPEINVWIK